MSQDKVTALPSALGVGLFTMAAAESCGHGPHYGILAFFVALIGFAWILARKDRQ